jgi:hypothetical protein
MTRAGRFIDPLRLPMLQAEPIARRERAAFDAEARRRLQRLAQGPEAGAAAAAAATSEPGR